MSWTEDSQALADAWLEAQKAALASWTQMLGASAPPAGGSAQDTTADTEPNGVSSQWADLAAKSLEQWRGLAERSVQQWTAGSVPWVQEAAKRAVAGQEAMARLVLLFAQTWKDVAPRAEAGEDWSQAMARHTERMRAQFMQTPEQFAHAGKDAAELWQLYLEQQNFLIKPWTDMMSGAQHAAKGSSASSEMSSLFWNAYERTLGKLVDMPSLGLSRELQEKAAHAFDAWVALRRTSFDYQSLMAEAWGQAFERFIKTLVELGEKGERVESLRELFALWIAQFDEAFMEFFRSERYLEAQSRLVKASMTQRVREREILEAFMKMRGLPTPSDIDDANRRIYELTKQVRALKKKIEEREKP